MISKISKEIRTEIEPIAMLFSDTKPDKSIQIKSEKWVCAMNLIAMAAKGKTVVFDKKSCGCVGAGTGFGFGNQYKQFPGGEECSYYFFSVGNKEWEDGRNQIIEYNVHDQDDFSQGVGFLKTPLHAKEYIKNLPIKDIGDKYIIFKPLSQVELEHEEPSIITFFLNQDQLSVMVTMANYERYDSEGTIIPCCSGCQAIGIYAMDQLKEKNPKAVVGMVDPTARLFLKKHFKKDYLTFSVPYQLYNQMEHNVEGSLLEKAAWKKLSSMSSEN
ncbi:DUF169 domain-containing protein [Blautia pseudococcoides]|nr:DUF169 domain-containing protein [Blautia pseudococcoides]